MQKRVSVCHFGGDGRDRELAGLKALEWKLAVGAAPRLWVNFRFAENGNFSRRLHLNFCRSDITLQQTSRQQQVWHQYAIEVRGEDVRLQEEPNQKNLFCRRD